MRLFKGMIMSMSMFSALPMPGIWDDQAKKYIIPALPLVGMILGLASFGFARLVSALPLAPIIQTVLVLLLPFFLTGFIHVDGLMDTADAFFSRAERTRKIAILKDSHVGSFAVIAFGVVLLLQFAAIGALQEHHDSWLVLIYIPVISRAMAGLFVLNLPTVLTEGYAKSFREQTTRLHSAFVIIVMLAALSLAAWHGGLFLLTVLFCQIIAAAGTMALLYRDFKGISGDLSGFVLTVSESLALLTAAILQGVIR